MQFGEDSLPDQEHQAEQKQEKELPDSGRNHSREFMRSKVGLPRKKFNRKKQRAKGSGRN